MIRHCTMAVMLAFVATGAAAQNRSVQWSGLFEEGYRSDQHFIAKERASGISFWLYVKNHETWFTSFDRSNNRLHNHKLDYTKTTLKHRPSLRDVIYIHGKFFLIVVSAGKLYLHEIDQSGNVVDKLIEIPNGGYEYYDAAFRASPDSSQVVVFYHLLNVKTQERYESLTFVDPSSMDIVSNRIIQVPSGRELKQKWNLNIVGVDVDNKGAIVFETQLLGKRIRIPQYWVVKSGDSTFTELQVPRGEMTLGNVEFVVDKQGRFLFAGFFSWNDVVKKKTKPGGLMFGHIDVESATIPDLKITEMNDTISRSNDITFYYNGNMESKVKDDGGIILITEQARVDSRNYIQNYGDHIVNVDATGEIIYNVAVPVKQRIKLSLYTRYIDVSALGSFAVYDDSSDELHLIYNTYKTNLDSLSNPRVALGGAANAIPVVATIDEDGNIKYDVIDPKRFKGILLEPTWAWQTAPDEAMVVGEKDKKWCVGTITFGPDELQKFHITQRTGNVDYSQRNEGHYAVNNLKKVHIDPSPSNRLFYLGMSVGYSTIPKNSLDSWFKQSDVTIPALNKPVPEFNLMMLYAKGHGAGAFELGGDIRDTDQTYHSTFFFGLSGGYHSYYSKGRHVILLATVGGSSSLFQFNSLPNGPGNIKHIDSYQLDNSGFYLGASAKFLKTTGWFFGGGIDVGVRYHFSRHWWFWQDFDNTRIDYLGIPNIEGLSFYAYIPIGLCVDGRRKR